MDKKGVSEQLSILLSEGITRIAYFIIGVFIAVVANYFIIPIGGTILRTLIMHEHYDILVSLFFTACYGLCLASGIFFFIFGPTLYKKFGQRGRGTLQEVKEASKNRLSN